VSGRHKGRKRALDVVYAADLRGTELTEQLAAERARVDGNVDVAPAVGFADELVSALINHAEQIDQAIETASTGWPIARMPIIDRSILRLATAELMTQPDTAVAVVVSEAGKLAGEYSTDDSRGFVQGVLGAIAEKLRASSSTRER
jgi:N utilization substance protein B